MRFLLILSLNLLIVCVLMDLLPEIKKLRDYVSNRSKHFCNEINTKQKSWTADSHWTWNLSMPNLKKLYPTDPPINNPHSMKFIYDKTKRFSTLLPSTFVVSENWPKCADIIWRIPKMILDTTCKTSWAVAMASVLTDRLCIFTRGVQRAELSPVDVVQCCKTCSHSEASYPCVKGGEALSAWKYWIKNGIVSGGFSEENKDTGCKSVAIEYDFDNRCQETCNFKNQSPAMNARKYKSEKKKYRFGERAYSIRNNQKHIMHEIYQFGPVQTSFILHEDFLVYRNGVYFHQHGKRIGYHTVKIIGWGKENSLHYWLLVNIWGKTYGKNGTVKFLRGSNHLDIEENAISCSYRRLDTRLKPLANLPEKNDGHMAVDSCIALLQLVFCTHLLYNRKVYW